MRKSEAIIQSMTVYERENPGCLKASRKNRIARGSGTTVADVNRVLSQYEKMLQMMKMMGGMGGKMPNMGALKGNEWNGRNAGRKQAFRIKKIKEKEKKKIKARC